MGYKNEKYLAFKLLLTDHNLVHFPRLGFLKPTNLELPIVSEYGNIVFNDKLESRVVFEPEVILKSGIRWIPYIPNHWQRFFTQDEYIQNDIGELSISLAVFESATQIIREHCVEFYDLLLDQVKNVVLYRGKSNSFTTIMAHHTIFINTYSDDDILHYIEHISHEASHVIFNTYTHNCKSEIFTMSHETPFSEFSNNNAENATVYERFHGLYTFYNITTNLENLYSKGVFSGLDLINLIGRICNNMEKYGYVLNIFDQRDKFKNFGWKLFLEFRTSYRKLYIKHKDIIENIVVSNQPYSFDFQLFLKSNRHYNFNDICQNKHNSARY